jgi:hypothetical protein
MRKPCTPENRQAGLVDWRLKDLREFSGRGLPDCRRCGKPQDQNRPVDVGSRAHRCCSITPSCGAYASELRLIPHDSNLFCGRIMKGMPCLQRAFDAKQTSGGCGSPCAARFRCSATDHEHISAIYEGSPRTVSSSFATCRRPIGSCPGTG